MMKRKTRHLSSAGGEERPAKRSKQVTNGDCPFLQALLRLPETSPQDIEAYYRFSGKKSTDNEISKPFPPEMKDEIFRQKIYAQMDRALDSFIVRSGGPRFFARRHSELQTAEEHGYVPRSSSSSNSGWIMNGAEGAPPNYRAKSIPNTDIGDRLFSNFTKADLRR